MKSLKIRSKKQLVRNLLNSLSKEKFSDIKIYERLFRACDHAKKIGVTITADIINKIFGYKRIELKCCNCGNDNEVAIAVKHYDLEWDEYYEEIYCLECIEEYLNTANCFIFKRYKKN